MSEKIFAWGSRLSEHDEDVVDRACEAGHFADLAERWLLTPNDREEAGEVNEKVLDVAEEIVERAERLLGHATHGSRWAIVARALHERDDVAGEGWPVHYGLWIEKFVDALARRLEAMP